jgi:spore maturation protein CgeB
MRIVILGLSITSSWGNGHATMYRGLARALCKRGHRVLFLERDMPWYANNRDMPHPSFCETHLYHSLADLRERFETDISAAELAIMGSYVPEGAAVARLVQSRAGGVTAFYDIDTPVTLHKISHGDYEYLSPELIPKFDLYLSFTGGPVLRELERHWGARRARAFYCAVDPDLYYPEPLQAQWDLGYLGTYSEDRQLAVAKMLLAPAASGRGLFAIAGPGYPNTPRWPRNVEHIPHLSPDAHRAFYCRQRFTLNVTRAEMRRWGYSPSVRLFEAAGCGTPVISDSWQGMSHFFIPNKEISIASSQQHVLHCLWRMPEEERLRLGEAARAAVLRGHTTAHRAQELELYAQEAMGATART